MNELVGNQIATAIDLHIRAFGGAYSEWYVGIAADPSDRLINGHNANSAANAALYWDAGNDGTARAVEQHFVDKGCRGGGGGGDWQTKFVYVYKISQLTRE